MLGRKLDVGAVVLVKAGAGAGCGAGAGGGGGGGARAEAEAGAGEGQGLRQGLHFGLVIGPTSSGGGWGWC